MAGGGGFERCGIDPGLVVDPLEVCLILADEGVWNKFGRQQVKVDAVASRVSFETFLGGCPLAEHQQDKRIQNLQRHQLTLMGSRCSQKDWDRRCPARSRRLELALSTWRFHFCRTECSRRCVRYQNSEPAVLNRLFNSGSVGVGVMNQSRMGEGGGTNVAGVDAVRACYRYSPVWRGAIPYMSNGASEAYLPHAGADPLGAARKRPNGWVGVASTNY